MQKLFGLFLLLTLLTPPVLAAPNEAVRANNRLACELLREMGKKKGNLFFSPLSISTVMTMTLAGARGPTAAEMEKTLNAHGSGIHGSFQALLEGLNAPTKSYELAIANRIWLSQKFKVTEPFRKVLEKNYHSTTKVLDFLAPGARDQINDWVASSTKNKIKEIIPAGFLSGNTRLILTNAIYFKGRWKSAFPVRNTRDGLFKAVGADLTCSMMNQTGHFAYGEVGTTQVLEMPYQGDRLSMVVLLPKNEAEMAKLELDEKRLAGFLSSMHSREVQVGLPRYKISWQASLSQPFRNLGIKLAFLRDKADLSGVGGLPGELFIGEVFHKAFVDVQESGTEAAAVTAVSVGGGRAYHAPPKLFLADHPFIYLIRDIPTGAILFMGRLDKPEPSRAGRPKVDRALPTQVQPARP